jgi:hypothetical protein
MKISEILVEAPDDATAKMKEYLRKNKGKLTPDQLDAYFGKQGGKTGKIAYGTLARDKNVAAQRDSSRQAGSYTKKTTTPTVQTPGLGGSQTATKIAVAKPNTPTPGLGGSQKATRIAVAKPNTPPPGLGGSQKATRIKAGQTPSAAGEFGSNKPRANIASTTNMSGAATNPQASAKFDQSKPTAVAKPAKKIGIQPGNKPSADTMDNRNK